MKFQNKQLAPPQLDHPQSFIEQEHNCVLCGQQLQLSTEVQSRESQVTETAYCHRCGIKTRVKEHAIH